MTNRFIHSLKASRHKWSEGPRHKWTTEASCVTSWALLNLIFNKYVLFSYSFLFMHRRRASCILSLQVSCLYSLKASYIRGGVTLDYCYCFLKASCILSLQVSCVYSLKASYIRRGCANQTTDNNINIRAAYITVTHTHTHTHN
jgi:hypothetical protein